MTESVFSDKYHKFKALLVRERTRRRLSQVKVAKRLHRPQSYVSKYETGERRLDVVEFLQVARAIGFDPVRVIRELDRAK